MATNTSAVPKWIIIVSALIAFMEIGVAISLHFAPQTVVENADLTAKGVPYLINMWATRQFALGIIFAFAAVKKSLPMLFLAYLFFLIMFLGDLYIGILQKEMGMVIAAIIMCIISSAMLYILNKRKTAI